MVHRIVIGDLADQPLLHIPVQWAAQFPVNYKAEFREVSVSILELTLVDPRSPGKYKRYKIVRHHSGIWTSVPRPWLRDISARPGDTVEIVWNRTTATLTLQRTQHVSTAFSLSSIGQLYR